MDEVGVRLLTAGDCEAAAETWWLSRTTAAGMPGPVHTSDEVRRWFCEVLLPDGQTWIAERAGRLVGVLTLDGDELDQLYVVPEVSGQGVGSMLVDLAKALRPDGLALWTFETNVEAQEFYRRRGFSEVRRTDGADNEERAPDVRMVWGNHSEAGGEGLGSRA